MNELKLFTNNAIGSVRAMLVHGEPWFVAKDILSILELDRTAMRKLDDDEKGVDSVHTPGGEQTVSIVSEPGFYKLVMRSRKPEAKAFQRWVTHEVLPALRRDGAFVASNGEEDDSVLMARALLAADRAIKRKDALIEEMRPKALFADAVAASDGTCLVGELAKMLTQAGFPIGQNRLFALLRDEGFLGKSGCNRNVPMQRYVEQGLFRIKETAITQPDGHVTLNRTTKVTGKGQRCFLDRYAGRVSDVA